MSDILDRGLTINFKKMGFKNLDHINLYLYRLYFT